MSTNIDLTQTYRSPVVLDPHNRAAALPVATLFPFKKLLTNVVATAAASKTSNKTSKAKPNFPTRGRKKVRSGQAENNLLTRGSYKLNYYSWDQMGPKIICVLDECSLSWSQEAHVQPTQA